MRLNLDAGSWPDRRSDERLSLRRSVASETGRLKEVLIGAPGNLAMIPCNAVTRRSLETGLTLDPAAAARQHRDLGEALTRAGTVCRTVAPAAALPDLVFTRDAVLMSPWGLVELRPAARHRSAEPAHIIDALEAIGIPLWERVEAGYIEGGDVCLLRGGLLAIGCSGERTDEAGARTLSAMFAARGWKHVLVPFDPAFLHLDTIFTMVSPNCAVAYLDALDERFVAQLKGLGIDLIAADAEEVARLGVNLLGLGGGRVLAPADNHRLNAILARKGLEVIEVEIDQFARCGGGVHCLALPLARDPEHP